MNEKKKSEPAANIVKKANKIAILLLITAIISSSSGCIGPASFNDAQQNALSLVSYLGYEALGEDSIDHYKEQKVYDNGVAGVLYSYSTSAGELTENAKEGLEKNGFTTTEIEEESGRGWRYSWFSATNGDIITYVTSYKDGNNNCVSISAGPDDFEEDVFKIYAQSYEGEYSDYVRLRSDVRSSGSDEPKTIEHVAPLAGTIYSIKNPTHRLSGPQDAAVNVEAKRSYDEMLAIQQKVETNETYRNEFFNESGNETVDSGRVRYYPWGFFWISRGGYYSPHRYGNYPGSGPMGSPRGTGQTIRGGGGPSGSK